jgi:hypothetical protein
MGVGTLGFECIPDERPNPPDVLQIIVGRYDDKAKPEVTPEIAADLTAKLKTCEMELRSAKGSIHTLESELNSERRKTAVTELGRLGQIKNGLSVTVRFIDYSDADQADQIRGLMLSTTKWKAATLRDDGSTIRRRGPSRIECSSGNPETALAVTKALNYGMLLGEFVYEMEIIDSDDENVTFTIFPRSSIPPG